MTDAKMIDTLKRMKRDFRSGSTNTRSAAGFCRWLSYDDSLSVGYVNGPDEFINEETEVLLYLQIFAELHPSAHRYLYGGLHDWWFERGNRYQRHKVITEALDFLTSIKPTL